MKNFLPLLLIVAPILKAMEFEIPVTELPPQEKQKQHFKKENKINLLSYKIHALSKDNPSKAIEIFFKAIESNDIISVKACVSAQINMNAINPENGFTPLSYAINLGKTHIVELLLPHTDLNYPNSENCVSPLGTPLIEASKRGNKELAKLLINNGANIHQSDAHGYTAMSYAMMIGYKSITKLLRKNGAHQDEMNLPDIFTAIERNNMPALRQILELGIDSNMVRDDQSGYNLLYTAVKSNNKEAVILLLEHNADPNATIDCLDDYDEESCLHLASSLGTLEIIKLLIKAKADVNQLDSHGVPPAYYSKNEEVLNLFLEANAQVNIIGNEGYGLIYQAVLEENKSLIIYIHDKNLDDINRITESGETILIFAAQENSAESVETLLPKLDENIINQKNDYGNTALHFAALNNNVEIAKFLINYKADAGIRNAAGKTPLDIAREKGFDTMVKTLQTGQ